MRFGHDELRRKALLALEEALQECRYRTPRRSYAVRFALAYLWATSRAHREPFDEFWNALAERQSPWSFGVADMALRGIYQALRIKRDEEVAWHFWRERQQEESGGP